MGLFDGLLKGVTGSDVIGLVGTGLAVADMFSKPKVPGEVRATADRAAALYRALSDPNDPLFLQTVAEQEGRVRQDLLTALDETVRANRRSVARTGGLGFINPERRDESVNYTISRGFADANRQARDAARQYLAQQAGMAAGVQQAYAPVMQAEQARRQSRAGAVEMLLTGADRLFGDRMLTGSPQQIKLAVQGTPTITRTKSTPIYMGP